LCLCAGVSADEWSAAQVLLQTAVEWCCDNALNRSACVWEYMTKLFLKANSIEDVSSHLQGEGIAAHVGQGVTRAAICMLRLVS
jgi:hypothetical protein